MRMKPFRRAGAAVASAAVVLGGTTLASSAATAQPSQPSIQHVLLISVDGMHQSDLDWYIANHPNSELARLATGGAEYTNAQTPDPSDSDPAGTGLMTGGDPKVTGIYYDDEYSHGVFPPGTTKCSGPVPGGDVIYDSPDDKLAAVPDLLHNGSGNTFPSFDEGGSIYPGGIDKNPALIMNLSPHPQSGLNPATYPVNPKTCQPIQPWDYVGVNTIFQVIHNAGLRTAWSDKHAIYASFNGPGSNGMSIDDFFAPEIDSQAVEPNGVPYPDDGAWTDDNAATKQYDSYKVQAVINWINGYGHSGKGPKVGTPGIYGMNFQVVSTAEKLKSSPAVLIGPNAQGKYTLGPSLPGGYVTVDGQQVPGPLLRSALDWVNNALQRMVNTIKADGEAAQLCVAPRVPRRPGMVSGDVEGVNIADRQEFFGGRASGGTAVQVPVVKWYRWAPTSPGAITALNRCFVCSNGQRSALRRSALRAARRDTAVTVESAWCSAFAVRVDGSRRSAASARRCTSARVSGRAIASSSHIRRRLEKNAHMFRIPSSSPARCSGATRLVRG
jgi:Type I phosphodiesterase / nucleotide pyrophosphatase